MERENATAVKELINQQERLNQHQELQEKLQSFCRSRLDTLEEETLEEKEQVEQAATSKGTKSVPEDKIEKVEPIFGSTDIRYRHRPISESIVIEKNDSDGGEEAMVEKVIDEVVMVLDEEREEVVLQEVKVPSVLAALQDPLCLATPPSPNSYSSSPVKSEASSEGRQVKFHSCTFMYTFEDLHSRIELHLYLLFRAQSGVISLSRMSERAFKRCA